MKNLKLNNFLLRKNDLISKPSREILRTLNQIFLTLEDEYQLLSFFYKRPDEEKTTEKKNDSFSINSNRSSNRELAGNSKEENKNNEDNKQKEVKLSKKQSEKEQVIEKPVHYIENGNNYYLTPSYVKANQNEKSIELNKCLPYINPISENIVPMRKDEFINIGPIEEIKYLSLYKENKISLNLPELLVEKNIIGWRRMIGDGNCFYKAVLINYFEKLIIKCVTESNSKDFLLFILDFLYTSIPESYDSNKTLALAFLIKLISYIDLAIEFNNSIKETKLNEQINQLNRIEVVNDNVENEGIENETNRKSTSKIDNHKAPENKFLFLAFDLLYRLYTKCEVIEKIILYWYKTKISNFIVLNSQTEFNGLKLIEILDGYDRDVDGLENGNYQGNIVESFVKKKILKSDEYAEGIALYVSSIVLKTDINVYHADLKLGKSNLQKVVFNFNYESSDEESLLPNSNFIIDLLFIDPHYDLLYSSQAFSSIVEYLYDYANYYVVNVNDKEYLSFKEIICTYISQAKKGIREISFVNDKQIKNESNFNNNKNNGNDKNKLSSGKNLERLIINTNINEISENSKSLTNKIKISSPVNKNYIHNNASNQNSNNENPLSSMNSESEKNIEPLKSPKPPGYSENSDINNINKIIDINSHQLEESNNFSSSNQIKFNINNISQNFNLIKDEQNDQMNKVKQTNQIFIQEINQGEVFDINQIDQNIQEDKNMEQEEKVIAQKTKHLCCKCFNEVECIIEFICGHFYCLDCFSACFKTHIQKVNTNNKTKFQVNLQFYTLNDVKELYTKIIKKTNFTCVNIEMCGAIFSLKDYMEYYSVYFKFVSNLTNEIINDKELEKVDNTNNSLINPSDKKFKEWEINANVNFLKASFAMKNLTKDIKAKEFGQLKFQDLNCATCKLKSKSISLKCKCFCCIKCQRKACFTFLNNLFEKKEYYKLIYQGALTIGPCCTCKSFLKAQDSVLFYDVNEIIDMIEKIADDLS